MVRVRKDGMLSANSTDCTHCLPVSTLWPEGLGDSPIFRERSDGKTYFPMKCPKCNRTFQVFRSKK